jgi:DNA (cytosine-5)-methyltransferase 1
VTHDQSVPRRLTPKETERLQGFPDDWTLVDGMKDGPRYRMMGNAVTVNVAEWIGRQILALHEGGNDA